MILSVLGLAIAFVAYDYTTYNSGFWAAIGVAKAHGARVGSLLDWPFGRECRITFEQPLDRDAVADLRVLNSLAPRHWVGVGFNYEMLDADFEHARDILPKCHVFRVDPTGLRS